MDKLLKIVGAIWPTIGLGAGITKRRAAAAGSLTSPAPPKEDPSIEVRLQRLEELKSHGLIRQEEYESIRAAILREVGFAALSRGRLRATGVARTVQ